jgi:hypothetical protein
MRKTLSRQVLPAVLVLSLFVFLADTAEAQGQNGNGGRGNGGGNDDGGGTVEFTAEFSFSLGDRGQIQAYYASNPTPGLRALPPGTRKNLTRGKSIPPGIAKRFAPDALRSSLSVPPQYDVVVVGWDVLLVEAATGIIHDVLMDVIR